MIFTVHPTPVFVPVIHARSESRTFIKITPVVKTMPEVSNRTIPIVCPERNLKQYILHTYYDPKVYIIYANRIARCKKKQCDST